MKKIRKACVLSTALFAVLSLTGCAAGAATAGYSLRAKEADCLSAQGEQRITDRVKKEIMLELREGRGCSPEAQKCY